MSKKSLIYGDGKRSPESLERLQSLPMEQKVNLTKRRIIQFNEAMEGKISISFSGGKDSTVLLDIVRSIHGLESAPAVFFDTGLEYPEIRDFVKTKENVLWLRPEMTFKKVIEKWGYPLPSKKHAENIYRYRNTKNDRIKNEIMNSSGVYRLMPEKWKFLLEAPFGCSHKCCEALKKKPAKMYEKATGNHPIIATMAEESRQRAVSWISHGCNIYTGDRPKSQPMSFWKESDIWAYIKSREIDYSKIYDLGYKRTGCMFCMFGYFQELENTGFDKFEAMSKTHPKQYQYIMENLNGEEVIRYCKRHLKGYEDELYQMKLDFN